MSRPSSVPVIGCAQSGTRKCAGHETASKSIVVMVTRVLTPTSSDANSREALMSSFLRRPRFGAGVAARQEVHDHTHWRAIFGTPHKNTLDLLLEQFPLALFATAVEKERTVDTEEHDRELGEEARHARRGVGHGVVASRGNGSVSRQQ